MSSNRAKRCEASITNQQYNTMNKYNEFLTNNNLESDSIINGHDQKLLIDLFLIHKDIIIYDDYKPEVELFFEIYHTADGFDVYCISETVFRGNVEQELYKDEYNFYDACADMLYDGHYNYIYLFDYDEIDSIFNDGDRMLEYLEENEVLIIDEDSESYDYIINPNLLAKR